MKRNITLGLIILFTLTGMLLLFEWSPAVSSEEVPFEVPKAVSYVPVEAAPVVKPTVDVQQLLILTNAERTKVGLPALAHDINLDKSATDKCNDMADRDYWAHHSPDGTGPEYFIDKYTYYENGGENLARNFHSASGVVEGWVSSPTHYKNLIGTNFQRVGFGVCHDDSGPNRSLLPIVVQHLVGL